MAEFTFIEEGLAEIRDDKSRRYAFVGIACGTEPINPKDHNVNFEGKISPFYEGEKLAGYKIISFGYPMSKAYDFFSFLSDKRKIFYPDKECTLSSVREAMEK